MEYCFSIIHGSLTVPCRLTEPQGDIRRLVLGIHGLGGSMNDVIQTGIAEEMSLFYSAVLDFDFPCHGSSAMDREAFTLKNCSDSLLCAAQYLRQRYPQVEELCIFATGFGAYMTLVVLPELMEMPGNIRLVIQTPSVAMHDTLLTMLRRSAEELRAIDRVMFPAPRPFEVSYSLYEDLRDNPVLTEHPIPMLILHSERNAYIRMADIQRFRRLNPDSRLVIIPGTSHTFQEAGAWDMVLDLTRDWFDFQQVLLDGWI